MIDEHARPIVLLVDDTPTNLEVLIDTFSEHHLNVSVALNGEEALKQAEDVQPDCILLDVVMPGIDGFETCRRLKRHAATRDIPVIFMTALSETVDKVKGFEAGGVDYITKPFQHQEVLSRVNAHLTIRRQQQELQTLNADKDRFFSILAHDLRNSVSGFLAFGKLLKDIDDLEKDEFLELAGQFQESADRLMALLENLLTWSRIQRGLLEFQPHQVSLEYLVRKGLTLLTPVAQEKEITLHHDVPGDTFVVADANMLDTVVRNLLSNAIKFTPIGGSVTLSANLTETAIMISVSDTGIGMSDEQIAKLFHVGTKTQRLGTSGEKGTGLGLVLCKEFVEQHGSTLHISSREGEGSAFSFSLPRVPDAA